jgi:aspartyl-tRNA(Asn)/glutamyl-tRNA(Gln) amidotransferase subunit B
MLESGKTPTQETRGWNEIKNLTFPQRSKEEAHDYRYFPEPDIPPIRFAQDKIEELKTKIGELPEAKANRFINQYGLTEYQAGILTEQKEMADYYEKVVGEMREMGEMRVTIANWIINKKIDWQKEPPESVAKKVAASQQTVAVDEKELEKIVQKVLAENPKVLEDYKNGKTQVLGVLIGKVVGIFGADARLVKSFLEKLLSGL